MTHNTPEGLPPLPEPDAWRTPDEWPLCYQYTHEEPDAERIAWAARYGRKHEPVITMAKAQAYAREALRAQAAGLVPVEIDFTRPLETSAGESVKHICADVIEFKSARMCVDKVTGIVYGGPYPGLKIRNVAPPAHVPADMEAMREAHRLGFLRCAVWAQRDDLFVDTRSPTYRKDRDFDLSKIKHPTPEPAQAVVEGWKWMTHPDWNNGQPIPVKLYADDGVTFYIPFDGEYIFEWDERDSRWQEVAASELARAVDAVDEPYAYEVPGNSKNDSRVLAFVGWYHKYGNPLPDSAIPLYLASRQPQAQQGGGEVSAAARDVMAERERQVSVEGWTPEHDDEHGHGEMARAAGSYAIHAAAQASEHPGISMALHTSALGVWPWGADWNKPTTGRRNLIKAGALILAEIERLDRAAAKEADHG